MAEQKILIPSADYAELDRYLEENGIKRLLLVCGGSIRYLKINDYFLGLEGRGHIQVTRFSDFQPNPQYESVVEGVRLFLERGCDAIFAVGGGSAMDVAKCIKLYTNMDHSQNYLKQPIVPNDIPLFVMPTTAGTGSEATRYAVIYYQGEKQSVAHESIIPSLVVFQPEVLTSLPAYQKRAALMDALCHAIESFWSVNSTEESQEYSRKAISMIMEGWGEYLSGNEYWNQAMLEAANIAGKAINITQTTAGHAMCYKLTSLYGTSHGHAAALCVAALWEYMAAHPENCIDSRGQAYVQQVFDRIAEAMGCGSVEAAIGKLRAITARMGLTPPKMEREEDFVTLKNSVNPVRLKNNPVGLSVEAIDGIYHKIFEEKEHEG